MNLRMIPIADGTADVDLSGVPLGARHIMGRSQGLVITASRAARRNTLLRSRGDGFVGLSRSGMQPFLNSLTALLCREEYRPLLDALIEADWIATVPPSISMLDWSPGPQSPTEQYAWVSAKGIAELFHSAWGLGLTWCLVWLPHGASIDVDPLHGSALRYTEGAIGLADIDGKLLLLTNQAMDKLTTVVAEAAEVSGFHLISSAFE